MERAQSSTGFAVDLDAAGDAHRRLADENRRLWVESKRLLVAYKTTKADHDAAAAEVTRLREEITTLKIEKNELRDAKVQAAKFEAQLSAAQDRLADLEADRENLVATSKDKSERIDELDDEVSALQEERNALYAKTDEKSRELEEAQREISRLKQDVDGYANAMRAEHAVQQEWAENLRNSRRLLEQTAMMYISPMSASQAKEKWDACIVNVKNFQDTNRRNIESVMDPSAQSSQTVFAIKLLADVADSLSFLGRVVDQRNEFAAKVLGVSSAQPATSAAASGASYSAAAPTSSASPSAKADAGSAGSLAFWKRSAQ